MDIAGRKRLLALRLKQTQGEALSDEEYREAIALSRDGRNAAFFASEASAKKRAKKVVLSAADLKAKIEGGAL